MGHIATSNSISKFSHPEQNTYILDVLMETFYRKEYEDIRVRTTDSAKKLYNILYDQFESNVWVEYRAL